MKRIVLLAGAVMAFTGLLNASSLKVEKDNVLIPAGAYHPILSEEGDMLLYTTSDYKGLNLYQIKKNEVIELSNEDGAGFSALFSNDEGKVYYRCAKRENHMMMHDLKSYEIKADRTLEVLPMSREEVKVLPQKGGALIKSGKKNITKITKSSTPNAYSDYNKIIVEKDGIETSITPIEDAHSYMWVKVSPNGKKILFSVPYKGVFACDIDGGNAMKIGKGSYPTWYDDSTIVVTRSTNDGYHVETSQLIGIDLRTKGITELTTPQSMAEEASCASAIGTIVYSDINGQVRVINVSENE